MPGISGYMNRIDGTAYRNILTQTKEYIQQINTLPPWKDLMRVLPRTGARENERGRGCGRHAMENRANG
jgi:hypothetical protein